MKTGIIYMAHNKVNNFESGGRKCKEMAEDTKRKISKSMYGNTNSLGTVLSEDLKKEISERQTGANNSAARSIERIDPVSDEIKFYSTLSSVKTDGYNLNCVWFCCNGKQEQHKGFKWRYFNQGLLA